MKEPTMKEVLELVSFERDENGKLQICDVNGDVLGDVNGDVYGEVGGDVLGNVFGNVRHVCGKILNK